MYYVIYPLCNVRILKQWKLAEKKSSPWSFLSHHQLSAGGNGKEGGEMRTLKDKRKTPEPQSIEETERERECESYQYGSQKMAFLLQCSRLVAPSERQVWVGYANASLRNHSPQRERERESPCCSWPLLSLYLPQTHTHTHTFLITHTHISHYWGNLQGHLFNWGLNDIGSAWAALVQTPGPCGPEKTWE